MSLAPHLVNADEVVRVRITDADVNALYGNCPRSLCCLPRKWPSEPIVGCLDFLSKSFATEPATLIGSTSQNKPYN